jgi:hypothetical protein
MCHGSRSASRQQHDVSLGKLKAKPLPFLLAAEHFHARAARVGQPALRLACANRVTVPVEPVRGPVEPVHVEPVRGRMQPLGLKSLLDRSKLPTRFLRSVSPFPFPPFLLAI